MHKLCLALKDQMVQQQHVELGRVWFPQATLALGDEPGEHLLTKARETYSLFIFLSFVAFVFSRLSQNVFLFCPTAIACSMNSMEPRAGVTRGRAWPQPADLQKARCQLWLSTNVGRLDLSASAG